MSDKIDIKSLTLPELCQHMEGMGEKKFRATQIYQWLHVKCIRAFDEMSNISKALLSKLSLDYELNTLEIVKVLKSEIDGTIKFLFKLSDGNIIESVFMRYHHGNSVCISSQVGCKMGCKFCASTIDGCVRNLKPSEMLDQIYAITRYTGERISNVVVMGSGEPLDNYDSLIRFIQILTDENGLNISQRNITVSTCGLVDKIRQLAKENLAITLAISLHASNDEKRKKIMPIANRYSLNELIDAVKYYYDVTKRRITFEYSLIAGVNDKDEDAKELAKLLQGLNAHINLIPVNPIAERDFKRPVRNDVEKFAKKLSDYKINSTIRREMGADINGACGQLRRSEIGKVK